MFGKMLAACLALLMAATLQAVPPKDVRLYTFDCGHIAVADMAAFDDSGHYDGKSRILSDPCFLIRHPKGDLLWDAGIGDDVADLKAGKDLLPGYRATVPLRLSEQLRRLGMSFGDIGYFAFSHAHVDHLGNANALKNAIWLLNPRDLSWLEQNHDPAMALISARNSVRTRMITGDLDLFGDGSVIILQTPGHTPGHQSLLLHLRHSGPVLLSGDLWHSRENYLGRRVPRFNTSRADTLESMDRITKILRETTARLIIQHESADIDRLPRSPHFLN